jgi:hypothetical protein
MRETRQCRQARGIADDFEAFTAHTASTAAQGSRGEGARGTAAGRDARRGHTGRPAYDRGRRRALWRSRSPSRPPAPRRRLPQRRTRGTPHGVRAAQSFRRSVWHALALLLLYSRTDRRRFEPAAVRWHRRLCLDVRGLSPGTLDRRSEGRVGMHTERSSDSAAAEIKRALQGRPGALEVGERADAHVFEGRVDGQRDDDGVRPEPLREPLCSDHVGSG